MRYGLTGKLTTRPGQRDAVVAILLRDVQDLKAVGCDLYMVSTSQDRPDAVWVTEVWASKEAHDTSLQLPTVKQAIAEAMPLLTGEFEHVELSVVGGLGVPEEKP
jgi:quinol monooxygenase YgiN